MLKIEHKKLLFEVDPKQWAVLMEKWKVRPL